MLLALCLRFPSGCGSVPTHRRVMRAGALIRRTLRRSLDRAGIEYTEDKGFLDSQFVLQVTDAQEAALEKWVREVNDHFYG